MAGGDAGDDRPEEIPGSAHARLFQAPPWVAHRAEPGWDRWMGRQLIPTVVIVGHTVSGNRGLLPLMRICRHQCMKTFVFMYAFKLIICFWLKCKAIGYWSVSLKNPWAQMSSNGFIIKLCNDLCNMVLTSLSVNQHHYDIVQTYVTIKLSPFFEKSNVNSDF